MWDILGIELTIDEKTIKRAYIAKLKTIDKDNDIEAFSKLRKAYENALSYAENPKPSAVDVATVDVDNELVEIQIEPLEIYRKYNYDFDLDRRDFSYYEELFASESFQKNKFDSYSSRLFFNCFLSFNSELEQKTLKLADAFFGWSEQPNLMVKFKYNTNAFRFVLKLTLPELNEIYKDPSKKINWSDYLEKRQIVYDAYIATSRLYRTAFKQVVRIYDKDVSFMQLAFFDEVDKDDLVYWLRIAVKILKIDPNNKYVFDFLRTLKQYKHEVDDVPTVLTIDRIESLIGQKSIYLIVCTIIFIIGLVLVAIIIAGG